MNERAVSSTTDSWDMGMSRPVKRKGIVLFTSILLGLEKGREVEIVSETGEWCRVRSLEEPRFDKNVPKQYIKEVDPYAR